MRRTLIAAGIGLIFSTLLACLAGYPRFLVWWMETQ